MLVLVLVPVELAIDGGETHWARLDFGVVPHDDDAFFYERTGDEVRALTDAIRP